MKFPGDLAVFAKGAQAAQAAVDEETRALDARSVIVERPPAAALEGRQHLIPGVSPAPPASSNELHALRPRPRRRRAATFKVEGGRPFDGQHSATVTIAGGMFTVRPRGLRRVYELPFADVVRGVIFDVVRAELAIAAAHRKKKKARR